MKPPAYASDWEEISATLGQVEAIDDEMLRRGEVSTRQVAGLLGRLTILGLKVVLGIDRAGDSLPFEYGVLQWVVTYLLRILTLLLVLVIILTVAAIPLLFIDLWAAAAILLLDFGLLSVIAIIGALCLWWIGRRPGSGSHRRRFLLDLTGALGRLTTGLR